MAIVLKPITTPLGKSHLMMELHVTLKIQPTYLVEAKISPSDFSKDQPSFFRLKDKDSVMAQFN